MKYPFSRRTTLIIGAILGVFIIIGLLTSQGKAKELYVTDTVKRTDVMKTVDVTGSLSPLSSAELSFQTGGSVQNIYVRVGDAVRKGDILASLDAADLSADARRAQAEFARELAGARDEDKSSAYADVMSAESTLRFAENTIEQTRAASTSSLTLAHDELERAQENQIQTVQDDARAVTDALKAGLVTVRSSLSKADELLGVENTLFGNEFEREFGALNPQTVTQAKELFSRAVIDRNLAESSLDAAVTLRALEETAATLGFTRQALDATSADSVDLSLHDIIAYKADIDAARNATESDRAVLARALADQASNAVSTAHAVRSAELNLAHTQVTSERDITKALADADSAQASLMRANAAYSKLISGPREVDLAPYRASRDAAWARYEKAVITSPIDGKVGKIDLKIGETVQPGTAVATVISTSRAFEVVIDVPESDVAHLTLSDKATITFDAFGSDAEFSGSLTSLDLTEKMIEGVVFYEARVAIADGSRMSDLRSGMSADVTIATDSSTATLAVPTRAVLEKDGKKIVRILVNDELMEKEVTVGLRGDGGVTEILSGVAEGETVVVSIKK